MTLKIIPYALKYERKRRMKMLAAKHNIKPTIFQMLLNIKLCR